MNHIPINGPKKQYNKSENEFENPSFSNEKDLEYKEKETQKEKAAEQVTPREIEKIKDDNLRLIAEMENMRKRLQHESENIRFRERVEVVKHFLPTLDCIQRALDSEKSYDNPWYEGFQRVYDLFLKQMKQIGVEPVNGKGSTFDPSYHEAVSAVPMPDRANNEIYDVVETGYMLDEKLVRPAKVIVVKNS